MNNPDFFTYTKVAQNRASFESWVRSYTLVGHTAREYNEPCPKGEQHTIVDVCQQDNKSKVIDKCVICPLCWNVAGWQERIK